MVLPLTCDSGNRQYPFDYCPSTKAAILFSVLFGISTSGHIWQAWHYGKRFCWVLIMGGTWETVAFITRVLEIKNPGNIGLQRSSFLFILLAPMWINAFDYMLLGRMVFFFMPDKKLLGVRAEKIAVAFVLADIMSFFIQLSGGVLAVNNDDTSRFLKGLHLYTAGVCVQEAVILTFVFLAVQFLRRLKRESSKEQISEANRLMIALSISLGLITYRIAFRIVEFSGDINNAVNRTIDNHEFFVYVFDAAPMFLALLIFNACHPGKILVGANSEYPKLTKEEKRKARMERKESRTERMMVELRD